MIMDELFDHALSNMETYFHVLEKQVPAPKLIPFGDGFAFRYTEQTIHQALLLKLARVVSGLGAAQTLLDHGFVQEQGAIQRMLDEFDEDITFLANAVISNDLTELHQQYLSAFWKEEFDKPRKPLESTQRRSMMPRKKIRAYIARAEGAAFDPSRGIELSRTMSKAYSGYVHAASPHIMELYGGSPPRFHLRGMLGTRRIDVHRQDLWNYFYRGISAFAIVAMAFGDKSLFASIRSYMDQFAENSGQNYLLRKRD
jgi:hypothetical protein